MYKLFKEVVRLSSSRILLPCRNDHVPYYIELSSIKKVLTHAAADGTLRRRTLSPVTVIKK